jgi:hypothetical protein
MGKSKRDTEWSQTAKGTTNSAVTSFGEGRSIRNAVDLCTVPFVLFAEDSGTKKRNRPNLFTVYIVQQHNFFSRLKRGYVDFVVDVCYTH